MCEGTKGDDEFTREFEGCALLEDNRAQDNT